MAKRALKVAEYQAVNDPSEPDTAAESLTEYKINPTRGRRLTDEIRAAIMQDLADGLSKKATAEKHNTSYTTVNNLFNSLTNGSPNAKASHQPRLAESHSSLHRRIYLIGYWTVVGNDEAIDKDQILELRQEIEAQRKQDEINFALGL